MTNAPVSVIRDMLDMVATVEGTTCTLYESDHPLAGQVFREWVAKRGYMIVEHEYPMPGISNLKPIRVLRAAPRKGVASPELFINVHLDRE